jgi:ribosomal protein S18 acetylase RimI-like enzyme
MESGNKVEEFVSVSYLELNEAPVPAARGARQERIAVERMTVEGYVDLYRAVGAPVRWDQRLRMSREDLRALLDSDFVQIYVLRDGANRTLGMCEFDRSRFPEVELKNFGLIPEAQGRRLGSWLLRSALAEEWGLRPARIWLHTDNWDHPSAVRTYEAAGFRIYLVRDEPSGEL